MDINLKGIGNVKVRVTKNSTNSNLYEYYIGDVKIGVYDPRSMRDKILISKDNTKFISEKIQMKENTLENELSSQIKDAIDAMNKEEILEEAEETKNIEDYAEEIGIEKEKIKSITTIELDEERGKDDKEKEEKSSKTKQNDKQNIDGKKTQATTKDVNIKQEIDLNERANEMKDLKGWLGANIPSEFTKIGVIYSEDVGNMKGENGKSYNGESTRYSLVVIGKDGQVEPLKKYLPQLQQRAAAGSNPSESKVQVDAKGKVEQDAVFSEYELGNKIIQIDNKEHGHVEMSIGQVAHSSNETMATQMRDRNTTFVTDIETREVMGEYERNGNRTVDENLRELEEHKKNNPECDKLEAVDVDGDPTTSSHNHNEDSLNTLDYNKLAIKWGLYDDHGQPNQEKAKEMLERTIKTEKDKQKSIDEIIENISAELEGDYRGEMQY